MRQVKLPLENGDVSIDITWKVARDIAERYADPYEVANDIVSASSGGEQKHPFTLGNCAAIFAILLEGHSDNPKDDAWIAAQKLGAGACVELAVSVIMLICTPEGENLPTEGNGKKQ